MSCELVVPPVQDSVVLLEFPDEAAAYVEQCRRFEVDPSAATVVSLDPKALALEVTPDSEVQPGPVYAVRRRDYLADAIQRTIDTNGKAPLPPELFQDYVYQPKEVTPFPQLVRNLVEGLQAAGVAR